ncbi:MAG: hypothetical protein V4561_03345 [Bacteroidota bacterium]
MRMYAGLILLVCFIGWVLYRLLIKRDLLKHKAQIMVSLFFLGAWALVYWMVLR